jgi:arylsulfatase A-like enzyme
MGPKLVLLVTIDTLRADTLSSHEAGASLTPRLDAFAANATVFLEARSPAPWTKPAIASVLTGLAPAVHGTLSTAASLDARWTTLAERFSGAGYLTSAVVANPHLGPEFGFDQGFDRYRTVPGPDLGRSVGAALLRRLRQTNGGSPRVTELATDALDTHGDRPLFLWVHYLDPHIPYEPPAEFLQGIDVSAIGPRFDDLSGARTGHLRLADAERAAIRELYRAEVRHVDHEVGRLLDAVRAAGFDRGALIVITSDHGEELWDHGSFEHGHTLYDELLRVPLIVKFPEGDPTAATCPSRVTTPLSIASIHSSLLSTAGLPEAEGPELPPSLQQLCASNGPSRPVIGSGTIYYEDRAAVVFDGLKYIRTSGADDEELYRLDRDPGEKRSILADCARCVERGRRLIEEHFARAASLRARLAIPPSSEGELSGEARRQLEALGYLR